MDRVFVETCSNSEVSGKTKQVVQLLNEEPAFDGARSRCQSPGVAKEQNPLTAVVSRCGMASGSEEIWVSAQNVGKRSAAARAHSMAFRIERGYFHQLQADTALLNFFPGMLRCCCTK